MGVGLEHVKWWYCAVSIKLGVWPGLIIGYVTEHYTSASQTPVREIAETQKHCAATGIIWPGAGLPPLHRASALLGRDDLGSTHALRHVRRGPWVPWA